MSRYVHLMIKLIYNCFLKHRLDEFNYGLKMHLMKPKKIVEN